MKAAIYSRFSTDKQTESSIADQVRVCTERADKEGHAITHRFEDQGISGAATGNRPGFQQMIAAGLAREFDVLYVMDLTRLARSQADLAKAIDRLTAKGVRILTVQNGYDSARKGHKLQVGLEGIIGEAFREMISEKTSAALESRAKAGRPTGGRAFGYTSQNELAEAEAPIVTEIFERYAAGESQHAIARDLNARGVPTPRGRPWYVSAIHALLHNERYLGRLVWNRTAWRKDPDTGKRLRTDRADHEHVVTIREDLRLVSDETWARVRARDTPATYGSHNARPKYPLSGLLLCAECGKAMTLAGGTNSRGYGVQRYVCSTRRHHGDGNFGCSNGMGVSRLVAEELIIEPLRDRLLNDQNFLTAVSALEKLDEKNGVVVFEPKGDGFNCDSGKRSIDAPDWPFPGAEDDHVQGRGALLTARLNAIESAAALGAMSQREAASRCAALRAEHENVTRSHGATDEASLLANAERLRAALLSAATDALRDALRRTLGTVRCTPTVEGESRYLLAQFEGGDAALLEWLAIGDSASKPGLSALVAGAGFEPATFGL